MNVLLAVLMGVVGVAAGMIVNVLADDLPVRENPRPPRYADGTARPPLAWSGLLAFLSGQRASPEGVKLTWRHPLVEAVLGLGYLLLTLGSTPDGLWAFRLLFLAILTLVFVIDMEHRLILFVVIVPACVLAVLFAILVPEPPPNLQDSLIGGLAGFGIFFLMFLGGIVFTTVAKIDEVAFGFGDVMLGTLSGLLLGWQAFLFALIVTVFLGAAGALLWLVSRFFTKGGYAAFTALPYGPYIVIGTVLMMLWREEIRQFLFR